MIGIHIHIMERGTKGVRLKIISQSRKGESR
jgi:hypothetical protein